MKWSSISALLRAPAFWGLSILLFAAPMLSKAGLELGCDTKFLYIAALLAALATGVTTVSRPAICGFPGYTEFKNSGITPEALVGQVEAIMSVAEISNEHARKMLEHPKEAREVPSDVFYPVRAQLDQSRSPARWTVTILISIVIAFLVFANGLRAYQVFANKPDRTELIKKLSLMNPKIPVASASLSAGTDVEIEHSVGGKNETTKGTVINPDDDGFIVIEDDDGKIVRLPKGKIDRITTVRKANS